MQKQDWSEGVTPQKETSFLLSTLKRQNSLLQDFAGVKTVSGLRKNQSDFKTIDVTMAINHHYLMETSRPAHPPKCECWKLGL